MDSDSVTVYNVMLMRAVWTAKDVSRIFTVNCGQIFGRRNSILYWEADDASKSFGIDYAECSSNGWTDCCPRGIS